MLDHVRYSLRLGQDLLGLDSDLAVDKGKRLATAASRDAAAAAARSDSSLVSASCGHSTHQAALPSPADSSNPLQQSMSPAEGGKHLSALTRERSFAKSG